MNLAYSWSGKDALSAKLARLIRPDATQLMVDFEKIITEGNTAGILQGLDKDGNALVPVKYRNGISAAVGKKPMLERRLLTGANPVGNLLPATHRWGGANDNLSEEEYKQLTGPPLAPRKARSRVIHNFVTRSSTTPNAQGQWFVEAAWQDVLDVKGQPFLGDHFHGRGHLPVRNLVGIRPVDLEIIRRRLNQWADSLLKR